jgi:23S rRNA (cytidine2498-2'-O)-methyltransferase
MRGPKAGARREGDGEPLGPGRWLWTCRAGAEGLLAVELRREGLDPVRFEEAVVHSGPPGAALAPAFARTGFPVEALASSPEEAAAWLSARPAGLVQVWVPDSAAGNARSKEAARWAELLAASRPDTFVRTPWEAHQRGLWLHQVCLWGTGRAALGAVLAREALSLSPGGRARMRRGEAPSRAAMKLHEALEWHGLSPGKQEVCVDLGAAPGGWSRVLLSLGARVVAVDPARLAPELLGNRRLRHVAESAFHFQPDEPADWLFCDMAWRPLEVAQLLGRWGKQRWATQLVANLKLPMKDAGGAWDTLGRAQEALRAGGWGRLRLRQLYHDRDEVTVSAVRG